MKKLEPKVEVVQSISEQVLSVPLETIVIARGKSNVSLSTTIQDGVIRTGSDGWMSLDRAATVGLRSRSGRYSNSSQVREWVRQLEARGFEFFIVTPTDEP